MGNTPKLFVLAAMLSTATLPTFAMQHGDFDDEELARQLSQQINTVKVSEEVITVESLTSSIEMLEGFDPGKSDLDIQRQISSLKAQRNGLLEKQSQPTLQIPSIQSDSNTSTTSLAQSDDEELARQLSQQINTVKVSEEVITVESLTSSIEMLEGFDPGKSDLDIQRQISSLKAQRNGLLEKQSQPTLQIPSTQTDSNASTTSLVQSIENATSSVFIPSQSETKFDRIRKKVVDRKPITAGDLRGLTDEEQLQLFNLQQENPPVEEITNTTLIEEQDKEYNKSLRIDQLKKEMQTTKLDIQATDEVIEKKENELAKRKLEFENENKELIRQIDSLDKKLAVTKSWVTGIDPREEQLSELKRSLKEKQDTLDQENQEKRKELILLAERKAKALEKLTTLEVEISGIAADII